MSVVGAAARELAQRNGLSRDLLHLLKAERRAPNRQAIVHALAWQNDLRAWSPMLEVLTDVREAPGVRGQAAEGIACLFPRKRRATRGYALALQVLTSMLTDPAPEVRFYAVFALGAARDRSVLPALRYLVNDRGRDASIPTTVGEEAMRAIRSMEDGAP